MKAPQIYGPRDVPALRRYLLEQWRSSTFPNYRTDVVGRVGDGELESHTVLGGAAFDMSALSDSSYWYVSAEMCEVLMHAEKTLPPETLLESTLVPQPSGLVVFEMPMPCTDAVTGEAGMGAVNAIVWGQATLPPWPGYNEHSRRALGISSYRCLSLDDGLSPFDMEQQWAQHMLMHAADILREQGIARNDAEWRELIGDIWGPLGRTDWCYNERADHRHYSLTDAALVSMLEDRRRLASMWLLMHSEGVSETTEDHNSRQERRRAERAGEPEPKITVVDVRRKASARHNGTDDETEHHKLKVRYLCSGHWRNQPYGEHRKYRRPTWISPHWRGPEDGPISGNEKVRVWK